MCLKLEDFLNIVPKVQRYPAFYATGENEGIEAITYDGAPRCGQKTKVFAYLGFPKDAEGPVPGVVLIHGGGGVPYLAWVKQWNDRGYAAIAFSTTGDFPKEINAGLTERDLKPREELWSRKPYGEFVEEGYVCAPVMDCLANSEKQLDEQWLYHAVAGAILAHNLLANDERVDASKVGICGISWGGVVTSLTIGYNPKIAFAVPIYGAGYLRETVGSIGTYFNSGKNPELWLAEDRFDGAKMPIFWQCFTEDNNFSLIVNTKSYLHTEPNNSKTRLSNVYNMRHSHRRAWWRNEALIFADWICRGGLAFPQISIEKNQVRIFSPEAEPISLRLFYITEHQSYAKNEDGIFTMQQEWQQTELKIIDGAAEIALTDEMKGYYFELTAKLGDEDIIVTTPYIER